MSDNFAIPLGTQDGPVVALDDIGGVKYQRVKMTLGADGVTNGDVSSSNPMPVSVAQRTILSIRLHITGALNDQAVATPASGKSINPVHSAMAPAASNTADMSFRVGCGVSATPTTTGVIHAHAGLGGGQDADQRGDGSAAFGQPGAADVPLRITCSDPLGSAEYLFSWYES